MGKKADQEDKLVVGLYYSELTAVWMEWLAGIILFFWAYTEVLKEGKKYFYVTCIILVCFLISVWLSHYSVIFDKEGCTKKYLFYKRKYRWSELVVRQEYSEKVEDTYKCDAYKEGVFFRTKRDCFRRKPGIGGYGMLHPFSSIVINFEGTFMWGAGKDGYLIRKCEVKKETFFSKMDEWGIDISRVYVEEINDSELPNQLVAQNDKKVDEYRKFGVWLFIIIMGMCGIMAVMIYPTMGGMLLACVCMLFGIWMIIMQWYTEYKIIIDKYGCTKTWWKYKKKYTWDELTVRKICSPMGNYAEGILFATYLKSPKEKDPEWYYYMHPFSSFTINFKGMSKFKESFGDQCAVDKELLLQCLAEWGIELEDARKKKDK